MVRLFGVVTVSCLLTAAICSLPFAQWRLSLLQMKTAGRLSAVSWLELGTRLIKIEAEQNGGRWVLGPVTLESADAGVACPANFVTPLGRFVGQLDDEWHLEHTISRYLGWDGVVKDGVDPRIEPGDTVLEVGAWIGVFTRYALSRGARRIIAIEPVTQNIECFKMNLAQELATGRVQLIEAAAWDAATTLTMSRHSPHNQRGSLEGVMVVEDGELTVQGVALDDELMRIGVDGIDVISMDIEGAERYALAGLATTIEASQSEISLCLHHKEDDEAVLTAMLIITATSAAIGICFSQGPASRIIASKLTPEKNVESRVRPPLSTFITD